MLNLRAFYAVTKELSGADFKTCWSDFLDDVAELRVYLVRKRQRTMRDLGIKCFYLGRYIKSIPTRIFPPVVVRGTTYPYILFLKAHVRGLLSDIIRFFTPVRPRFSYPFYNKEDAKAFRQIMSPSRLNGSLFGHSFHLVSPSYMPIVFSFFMLLGAFCLLATLRLSSQNVLSFFHGAILFSLAAVIVT